MPAAVIEINAVAGSNTDLTLGNIVQLSNADAGGEVSYLWAMLDRPAGSAAVLSATNIENPTFTPDVEGTYLLRLTVNATLASECSDQKVAAVRQLKSRERIPSSGETVETSLLRGWAVDVNESLGDLDRQVSDSGCVHGNAGAALNRGDVVYVATTHALLSGEVVPEFRVAHANVAAEVAGWLGVVEGTPEGVAAVGINTIARVRGFGHYPWAAAGAPAVYAPVYVDDAGAISLATGTITRVLGYVASVAGGAYRIWMDPARAGAGAGERFLLNGAPIGVLPLATDVTAMSAVLAFARTDAGGGAKDVLTLRRHLAAGAIGIGASLRFEASDSGGTDVLAGHFQCQLTDVTPGATWSALHGWLQTGAAGNNEVVTFSPVDNATPIVGSKITSYDGVNTSIMWSLGIKHWLAAGGNGAVGMGAGLNFWAPNSTANVAGPACAGIAGLWESPTNANEMGALVGYYTNAGHTVEGLRLNSLGQLSVAGLLYTAPISTEKLLLVPFELAATAVAPGLAIRRVVQDVGGVGAANTGSDIRFYAPDDAAAARLGGSITSKWVSAVAALPTGRMDFALGQAGVAINAWTLTPTQHSGIVLDANNAAPIDVLQLAHICGIAGANGIGSGIEFATVDNAIALTAAARIRGILTDVTHGGGAVSQKGALILSVKAAGAAAPADFARLTDLGEFLIGATAPVGAEKLRVVGDAYIFGKLTVLGGIDPVYLDLTGDAGSLAVLAAANHAKLVYDPGAVQRLKLSVNGGAFAVVPMPGDADTVLAHAAYGGVVAGSVNSAINALAGGVRRPLPDQAAIALDPTVAREFYVLMDHALATRAITVADGVDGQQLYVETQQDATGGALLTWVNVTWLGGHTPYVSPTARKVDRFWLTYSSDEDTWYGRYAFGDDAARTLTWVDASMTPACGGGGDLLFLITCPEADGKTATINAPTQCYKQQRLSFKFLQGTDAPNGGDTLSAWNACFKWGGAALPLQLGANSVTVYDAIVMDCDANGLATFVAINGMQVTP